MKTTNMGRLKCRINGGTDGQGGGDGPVVVLMHGFGAPGTDLVPLGQVLHVPPGVRFVFPEAPVDLGPMFAGGRAWWELDLEMLARRAQGERIDRSGDAPEALPALREAVLEVLEHVRDDLGAAPDNIVLGGFSQGSMLACDVALHSDVPLAGLVLLSSTLINRAAWSEKAPLRRSLPIFQSHGRSDAVLGFEDAVALQALLSGAGCAVDFVAFDGGHDLPPPVLSGLSDFIVKVTTPGK